MAERIMKCVSLGLGQDLAFLEKMHQGMLSQDKGGEVMEIMISTRYGKVMLSFTATGGKRDHSSVNPLSSNTRLTCCKVF